MSYVTEESEADVAPSGGYRSYEVYQRERVGETTKGISPRQLIGDDYLTDPYPLVGILRENYPCYRDWVANRFWITRYDDVTSVLADVANYQHRPRRWAYGFHESVRDLWDQVPILAARAERTDAGLEAAVERCLAALDERPDVARSLAARLPAELWGEVLGLAGEDLARFAGLTLTAVRGAGWHPEALVRGRAALDELASWFDALLAERRGSSGNDLISVAARLELDAGPVSGTELALAVLDSDHETLHGSLANLWFLLLTHPDQRDRVRAEPRLMKAAWLEAVRHCPPIIATARYARHEVERFGRLLPEGAQLWCSVAAANRDPRVFADPDRFEVDRADLCQREPRGQYRADGLASGITPGLGLPSVHPAVPRDRPRSLYALTRDVAVTASRMLLDAHPGLALAPGAQPELRSLRLGEMHTCWSLPITW